MVLFIWFVLLRWLIFNSELIFYFHYIFFSEKLFHGRASEKMKMYARTYTDCIGKEICVAFPPSFAINHPTERNSISVRYWLFRFYFIFFTIIYIETNKQTFAVYNAAIYLFVITYLF